MQYGKTISVTVQRFLNTIKEQGEAAATHYLLSKLLLCCIAEALVT